MSACTLTYARETERVTKRGRCKAVYGRVLSVRRRRSPAGEQRSLPLAGSGGRCVARAERWCRSPLTHLLPAGCLASRRIAAHLGSRRTSGVSSASPGSTSLMVAFACSQSRRSALKQESLVPRTQSYSRLQPVEHHLALHLRLPAGGLRGGSSKAPAAPPSAPTAPRSAAAPPTL